MNIPIELMQKIEELEAEKSLTAAQEQANLEIRQILDEEPETEEQENGLVSGHAQAKGQMNEFSNEERQQAGERGGRSGNIPPKEHRFKPGQSGNPSGRPKATIDHLIRKLLTAQNQKFGKQVVEALLKHACAGNQTAIRELLARAEPVRNSSHRV